MERIKMKLTTVVPVYNVEKYIRTGLDSLLDQGMGYGEHEVLLIDDGSTDGSGRVCDEYSARHPGLFRTIHKSNGGVSSARNLGIREARGEYIHFMDPDDFISKGSYKALFDKLAESGGGYDYIGFEYNCIDTMNAVGVQGADEHRVEDVDIGKPLSSRDLIFSGRMWDVVWCYLVRRGFLSENRLWFKEGMAPGQDTLFSYQGVACGAKIVITSAKVYNYCLRPGSAVTYYPKERFKVWMDSMEAQIVGLRKIGEGHEDLREAMEERIKRQISWFFPRLLRFKTGMAECRLVCDVFDKYGLLPLPEDNIVFKSANLALRHPIYLLIFAKLYRLGLFSYMFKVLCAIQPRKYK